MLKVFKSKGSTHEESKTDVFWYTGILMSYEVQRANTRLCLERDV